jgi:hypothetical protein
VKLPDPARSHVILVGTAAHTADSDLPDLPAVENNLTDVVEALADPVHGWLTPESHTIIRNPAGAQELGVRFTKPTSRRSRRPVPATPRSPAS